MSTRKLPFSDKQLLELIKQFPTPFHVYDEAGIRQTARKLSKAFDWVPNIDGTGYVNHFAVKALPNPHVMQILAEEGMGADASSGPEIELSRAIGLESPLIMFTSNNTDPAEYREAHKAGAIINLDDINQIEVLKKALDGSFPDIISFRYNPGNLRTDGVNAIIGKPEDAKFGVAEHQIEEAYRQAKELGVKHFGIHTMLVSNELDAAQHVATARLILGKIVELSEKLGITFEFANLGGGLGIPYRPEQQPLDYEELRNGIKEAYDELITGNGLPDLRVVTENGRHVTGPHGYLVTTVRGFKDTYRRFVGVDATMADLMRPGMYDAYHHVTVVGRELGIRAVQSIVGSLCENNDFFARDRDLPAMDPGDIVVIHDTGAHGHSMGFNYNGKLRHAEVLWLPDGTGRLIRRAETREDLFATIEGFPDLGKS